MPTQRRQTMFSFFVQRTILSNGPKGGIDFQQLLARSHPYQLRFVSVQLESVALYPSVDQLRTLCELLHSSDEFGDRHVMNEPARFSCKFQTIRPYTAEKGVNREPIHVVRRNSTDQYRWQLTHVGCWMRSTRNVPIHSRARPSIPKATRIWPSRIVWSTILNAAPGLRRSSSVTLPSSAEPRMSETTRRRVVSVEWWCRYTDRNRGIRLLACRQLLDELFRNHSLRDLRCEVTFDTDR